MASSCWPSVRLTTIAEGNGDAGDGSQTRCGSVGLVPYSEALGGHRPISARVNSSGCSSPSYFGECVHHQFEDTPDDQSAITRCCQLQGDRHFTMIFNTTVVALCVGDALSWSEIPTE